MLRAELRPSQAKRVVKILEDDRKKYEILIKAIMQRSPFAAALGVTEESIKWALSYVSC